MHDPTWYDLDKYGVLARDTTCPQCGREPIQVAAIRVPDARNYANLWRCDQWHTWETPSALEVLR